MAWKVISAARFSWRRAPRRVSATQLLLIGTGLLVLAETTNAAPVIYNDESLFLAELAALGGSTLWESFEDDAVWENSRNTIPSPGSTPAVISQGLVWTTNYPLNNVATGTVGGSAPDGAFAIYSLPHGMTTDSGLYCDSAEDPDIPIECYQNDGIKVASEPRDTLFAFGGRIDTANSGKVTFLLDGVDINGNDTDNAGNWQREGDFADNWDFVGVIDSDGFASAELRELRGKDFQQVLLFSDGFTIRRFVPEPGGGPLSVSCLLGLAGIGRRRKKTQSVATGARAAPTKESGSNPVWVADSPHHKLSKTRALRGGRRTTAVAAPGMALSTRGGSANNALRSAPSF